MSLVYNLATRIAAEDTELDGVQVPKNTMVSIHIGAVNRHPAVWENPDVFDPEPAEFRKWEPTRKLSPE